MRLTSLFAVLDDVAVQPAGTDPLGRHPLERARAVGDVVHHEARRLAGRSWFRPKQPRVKG